VRTEMDLSEFYEYAGVIILVLLMRQKLALWGSVIKYS